ncbi:MAG: hypothetical protein AAGC96_07140 [Pseudomonadota bacterium]
MFRPLVSLMMFLLALAANSAVAQQTSQTFSSPSINGVRVDWCKFYGRQCGEPAATLFCQQRGFARAAQFSIDPGIGRSGVPTVVTGDGRLCREAICSGFQAITCVRQDPVTVTPTPSPRRSEPEQTARNPSRLADPKMIRVQVNQNTTRFRYPHLNNTRLDWCLNWGTNCGEVAANRFCQEMGFLRANRYVKDTETGENGIPSLVYDDDRLCTGRYCNAFRMIACTNRPAEETVAQSVGQQNGDEDALPQSATDVAFIAPLPIPKPPLPTPTEETVVKPEAAVGFAGFEALAPTVVAVNWVNLLDSIKRYPDGASLFRCAETDCVRLDETDFEVDPDAEDQTVRLNFRVNDVPHATAALWQVSYLPFPPFSEGSETDLSPQGLLDYETVSVSEGWFSFDPRHLTADLPGGAGPAILHVRVLPVSQAGLEQVIGQPSNTMRIFYGAGLPEAPPYMSYDRQAVPDSQPKLRLTKLAFQPFHQVARWPPGCQIGDAADKEGAAIEASLADNWGWNSKSYQWMRTRLVDIIGEKTANTVSGDSLTYAVDVALVSARIPPDIPNLNVMIRDGADGLADGLAQAVMDQVPATEFASKLAGFADDMTVEAAAAMDEDEQRARLEDEISKTSRAALLQTADELDAELAKDDRNTACANTYFQGAYTVTVENTGDERYEDLSVAIKAEPVYRLQNWTIDLDPGEKVTLVGLGAPKLPNGPYSENDLSPDTRTEEDLQRWRSDIVYDEQVEIEVSLPGALECLGGDPTSQFCERQPVVVHTSPPQPVTDYYEFSQ